ncbi:MAG: hypothetical protein ACI853_001439 [Paracoccaceae bacterium]|jgi:hypothetical protein
MGWVMHGLINRSLQCFMNDTYGTHAWAVVARNALVDVQGFEAMLDYDDVVTHRLLASMADFLDKPTKAVLEDVGTYLVTHNNTQSIRRLLRFGGDTYVEFLLSLDDLHDRVMLAVPDLQFPQLELMQEQAGQFTLYLRHAHSDFAYVFVGVLRALADDYGALVLLEPVEAVDGSCVLDIRLADVRFSEGNAFSLYSSAQQKGVA